MMKGRLKMNIDFYEENLDQFDSPDERIRPGLGFGGFGSGFGFLPGLGFGRPGLGLGRRFGFPFPFLAGLAAGALLTPRYPYPPYYYPYPYPQYYYPYYYPYPYY
ncbi:MAG: spore coat protein [Haloplasmataceae bacterium]|jgi:hypothetical protein|nr:spore coat protein [Haloplasmataceae bacterium]